MPLIPVFLLLLTLNACGFHLRGVVDLPPEKRVIALQGIRLNHPFARDLQLFLDLVKGKLVTDPGSAGSIVIIHETHEGRRVVSLNENGKAIEFELTYRVRYEIRSPRGKLLLPTRTIKIRRIYLNTQLRVIGKSEEEAVIRKEMRREAARTLLRQLQTVLAEQDAA